MDRQELRRKALVAAASVTLAFGCRDGKVVEPVDTDAGGVDSALVDTDPSDTPTDSIPADTDRGLVDTDAADTDRAVVDTDPADTDPAVVDTDPALVDTDPDTDRAVVDTAPQPGARPDCDALGLDLLACCDALRPWCGQQLVEGTTAYNDCVYGPGFDGSTGCIPWGPPVPPALA